MGTIDIGIRHNDNLVVTKFADIKVFMNTCTKRSDHSFDLSISINLIQSCLLDI